MNITKVKLDALTNNGHLPKPIIRRSSSSGKLSQRRGSDTHSCTNCGNNSQHQLPISPLAIHHNPKEMDDSKYGMLTGKAANGIIPRNDSGVSINPQPMEFATSRRPSVMLQDIMHARRPSQLLAAFRGKHFRGSNQDQDGNDGNQSRRESIYPEQAQHSKLKNRRMGDDVITTGLSALYCKFLVILGVAMPITEIISEKIPTVVYQSFYVYMYGGSILFVVFVYSMTVKNRALFNIVKDYHEKQNNVHMKRKAHRFGSFYLRVGAIAFAIGNMVYSGLEFGQFFELNGSPGCRDVFIAITPIMRTILCIIQVQFIFLNTKDLDMGRHKVISRFGLMHMVATNLCEWLYVLVEETKHEIFHVSQHEGDHKSVRSSDQIFIGPLNSSFDEGNNSSMDTGCTRTNIMGALVQEVSPFLFPCTIEYSLICAVILYEMWKTVKSIPNIDRERKYSLKSAIDHQHKGSHHFSVDCSQAHRGLFFGILIIVMTIISMIMYFVLYNTPGLRDIATKEVTIWEISMFAICSIAIITAMILMRDLKYVKNFDSHHSMALDCNLLILAQTGVYLYALFSIMGAYYNTIDQQPDRIECIIDEVFCLFQTSIQTLFILNACQRRCKGQQQIRKKPGRDFITFLLVANVSMWFINTLIKGRATFRNGQMDFFGIWAWTIITHTSMPLAIFYRFHSTVCFFEIWKVTYKAKTH